MDDFHFKNIQISCEIETISITNAEKVQKSKRHITKKEATQMNTRGYSTQTCFKNFFSLHRGNCSIIFFSNIENHKIQSKNKKQTKGSQKGQKSGYQKD